MKKICLIPVKNEAWILEEMLKNISAWADIIILADQSSTDHTREICTKFPKVTIINNPNKGHSNQVRWLLLDKAREFPGNNLIICIDADEALPTKLFLEEIATLNLKPGDVLIADWIQLWKGVQKYNDSGVWHKNIKSFAFVDDRKINYPRLIVVNDHTSRVPEFKDTQGIKIKTPLLHFQFIAWQRTQWKQAWYRCSELIKGGSARKINHKYSPILISQDNILKNTPDEWLSGLIIPTALLEDIPAAWHQEEIIKWFKQFKIEFFEPLQIWHIPELHRLFVEKTGREPQVAIFPKWLIYLNNIKNKIFHA